MLFFVRKEVGIRFLAKKLENENPKLVAAEYLSILSGDSHFKLDFCYNELVDFKFSRLNMQRRKRKIITNQ